MNLKAKKEQLVKEFNILFARQIQIQAQLQLIAEQEKGTLKKKNDIQHKTGKKHRR